jgi:hypothetical protein
MHGMAQQACDGSDHVHACVCYRQLISCSQSFYTVCVHLAPLVTANIRVVTASIRVRIYIAYTEQCFYTVKCFTLLIVVFSDCTYFTVQQAKLAIHCFRWL